MFATILSAAAQTAPPNQFAAWRADIRKALYIPANLPPLEAKVWSSFSPTEGVIADRVTYRTSRGMIVPAIVYRPEHWKNQDEGARLPGIVIVNGHGGDKYSWYAFYSGMMFARAGAMVVTYDPIGEGERNIEKKSRASSHDKIVAVPEGVKPDDWGQRLAGLMQVDLMQAVSYLDSRPEVDPKRIAVAGYSMGAFVTGIAGAIDTRIHAILLSGGGTFDDESDGGKSYDVGTLPCQAPPWRSLKVLGDEPHKRGAVLYALNAERGPMLVENGSVDTVMDIPHRTPEWFANLRTQAIELDKAHGGTAVNMFTTHVDADKSHRTAWVERYGVNWLDEQIHFANWNSAQIAKMPTTHITEWLAANNMEYSMSKGYNREDREGGLNALGTGIPGIAHDQLNVLPAAEWLKLEDQLTYESWAAKALEAERESVGLSLLKTPGKPVTKAVFR
jgi:dienelactone hydrolase